MVLLPLGWRSGAGPASQLRHRSRVTLQCSSWGGCSSDRGMFLRWEGTSFSSSLLTGQAEVKNLMTLLPQGNPNALANVSSRSRSWLWCTRQSCTILGVCWLPKLPLQPLHYRCSILGFFGLERSRGSLSIRSERKSWILWFFILRRTKFTLPLTDFCNIFDYLFCLERTVLRVCLRLPSIFQAALSAVDISS